MEQVQNIPDKQDNRRQKRDHVLLNLTLSHLLENNSRFFSVNN